MIQLVQPIDGDTAAIPTAYSTNHQTNVRRDIIAFLVLAAWFSIAVNLLMLVSPLYMLQVYDRVLTSGSVETLILVSALAAGLMVTYIFADSARRHVMALAAKYLNEQLGSKLFNVNFDRPHARKSFLKDLADLSGVKSFFANGLVLPFFDLPFTPLFLLIMFFVHPLIGWIGVGGAVLLIAFAVVSELSTRRAEAEAQKAEQDAQAYAANLANGQSAIVSMGMAQSAFSNWAGKKAQGDRLSLETSKSSNFFGATTRGLRLTLQMAALGAGGWLVLQQQATPGVIIAASILLGRALAPIDQCIGMWRQIVRVRKSWSDLRVRFGASETSRGQFTPMPRPDAKLDMINLEIGLPESETAFLPAFSLSLTGGTILAVVGPSGAGKSSFLQTVTGVWPAKVGTVTLGGLNLHTWNYNDRGKYIGYLPQNVELLPGTVVDNISRYSGAENEYAVQAALQAGAHDVITSLRQGYDTEVAVSGTNVSAGQAQAIGLARAFFGDPVMIVLDEPSANLDKDTIEKLNIKLARKRAAGCLIIVSTHDVRLIQQADKVLLLNRNAVKLAEAEAYINAVNNRDRAARISGAS